MPDRLQQGMLALVPSLGKSGGCQARTSNCTLCACSAPLGWQPLKPCMTWLVSAQCTQNAAACPCGRPRMHAAHGKLCVSSAAGPADRGSRHVASSAETCAVLRMPAGGCGPASNDALHGSKPACAWGRLHAAAAAAQVAGRRHHAGRHARAGLGLQRAHARARVRRRRVRALRRRRVLLQLQGARARAGGRLPACQTFSLIQAVLMSRTSPPVDSSASRKLCC